MRSIILAVLACFAFVVHAQTAKEALSEIVRCGEVQDAGERLKCFDALVPRAKNALAEQEKKESRGILDWFGFSRAKPVTKPEDFGKPAAAAPGGEVTQITSTVLEFAKTARGKALFVLENGQVWRQLDADDAQVHPPDPGKPMKVTIEIGFMDSYNLLIEGRRALVKVRRLK